MNPLEPLRCIPNSSFFFFFPTPLSCLPNSPVCAQAKKKVFLFATLSSPQFTKQQIAAQTAIPAQNVIRYYTTNSPPFLRACIIFIRVCIVRSCLVYVYVKPDTALLAPPPFNNSSLLSYPCIPSPDR
jgi:hypothetical protein